MAAPQWPSRLSLEPSESLDPHEWEGTEPRRLHGRRRDPPAIGPAVVVVALIVAVAVLLFFM
jgi:hypothetical protein